MSNKKATRNYIKHEYAPGMSKSDRAKQRRATRAQLKSQAHENVQGAPTPDLRVQNAQQETDRAAEQAAITRKNLQEALSRRERKIPRTQIEVNA